MGTNFYSKSGVHIGKRSAAGDYCWDCHITLCESEAKVHNSDAVWFGECPKCGQRSQWCERLEDSSVGLELGFNKKKPGAKKKNTGGVPGVRTCSSFSWAIPLERMRKMKSFKNEYGDEFCFAMMLGVVEECPIHYFDMIGKDFC